jgi:hypothetical protein
VAGFPQPPGTQAAAAATPNPAHGKTEICSVSRGARLIAHQGQLLRAVSTLFETLFLWPVSGVLAQSVWLFWASSLPELRRHEAVPSRELYGVLV